MTAEQRKFTSPAGAIPSPELSAVTRTGSGSEDLLSMKTILLTQGRVALVDDEDYNRLIQFKWFAHRAGKLEYASRNGLTIDGKRATIKMHRDIMDAKRGEEIDHRDGNGLNNSKNNLRFCTRSQNCANRSGVQNTKSGFKGVRFITWNKKPTKPWRACIMVNRKMIVVGAYFTPHEAALAYNQAALQHFGEFAKINIL